MQFVPIVRLFRSRNVIYLNYKLNMKHEESFTKWGNVFVGITQMQQFVILFIFSMLILNTQKLLPLRNLPDLIFLCHQLLYF